MSSEGEVTRVFLNEGDVEQEIYIDDEDLPDHDPDDDDEREAGAPQTEGDGEALEVDDDSVHVFSGHADSVYSVACSPTDAGLVATGGGDDLGFIWRVGEGVEPLELKGHGDSIASVAFSTDGSLLATGGLDGIVIVWDVQGNLKQKLEGPAEAIEWVKWHPRGHLVLAGSEDFTAWLWNADNGACLRVFSGHSGSVACGDFAPNGRFFCTGGGDGSLRVWNPKSGEPTLVIHGHPYHSKGLSCLAISGDSSFAITGAEDGTAFVVNLQTGKTFGLLDGHTKPVQCVGMSSMLPLAATGGQDGKLIIWDLQTLTARSTCQHEDDVVRLIWPPSSHMIITCSLDAKVRVWDSRTGNLERTFQGHEDSIWGAAITPDGKFIVTGSDDGTARAFDCQGA